MSKIDWSVDWGGVIVVTLVLSFVGGLVCLIVFQAEGDEMKRESKTLVSKMRDKQLDQLVRYHTETIKKKKLSD